MKNLLVSGRPGVGKTTLMERVLSVFTAKRSAGFFTREVREQGHRTGFRIETLDGRKGVLASTSGKEGPRVGRYRVNMNDLDEIGAGSIEEGLLASDLIVIDEIGTMELFSERFRDAVLKAFSSSAKVIATVKEGECGFKRALVARDDTGLLTMSGSNREDVFRAVIDFLEGSVSEGNS